jgi:hypothetical protein
MINACPAQMCAHRKPGLTTANNKGICFFQWHNLSYPGYMALY